MPKSLPSRPLPIPGESPASPLMRAASINGYRSVTMLSNVHGLCESDAAFWINAAFTRPSRYRQIAARMGVSVSSVEKYVMTAIKALSTCS